MSYQAMTHVTAALVQDATLRPIDRLLWLLLANRHNSDTGMAWPSVPTLAREAGVNRRNVQKSLRRLEDSGYIRRVERFASDAAQTSNGYAFPGMEPSGDSLVAVRRIPPVSQTTPPPVSQKTPPDVAGDTGGVSQETPPGVPRDIPPVSQGTPKPLPEPTREPTRETTTNHDRGRGGGGDAAHDAGGQATATGAGAGAARTLAATWREHYGRNATPAQLAALRGMVDAEIPAGMPGLTAACIRYAAEQGKPFDYLRATFRGCLSRRQYPDTPRDSAPGAAHTPAQGTTLFRRPAPPAPGRGPAPDGSSADEWNRRQLARAGIDRDRLLALLRGPNPPDELDVYRNPAKYGVAAAG